MAECGFCQQRDKSVDSALICEGCCDKVAAWGAMWDLLGDLWTQWKVSDEVMNALSDASQSKIKESP